MKKIISSILILTMLISNVNVMCYAKTTERENKIKNTISVSNDYDPKLEKSVREILLELSNDKEFMDTLIKNYENSNKQKKSFGHRVVNWGYSGSTWVLKKVFNVILKVLGTVVGTLAVCYIVQRFIMHIVDKVVPTKSEALKGMLFTFLPPMFRRDKKEAN